MFKVSLKAFKEGFFDRKKVQNAADKATRRNLSRMGAFVRTRAKTSMRKGRGVSEPGEPPRAHVGLIRKFVLFAYEAARKAVVIGPARLSGVIGNAPEALEHGGTSEVHVRGGKTRRVTIRARPFMRPALEKELSQVPKLWRDSVR